MKYCTILGGSGFIGRSLASYLKLNGWECWIPDRSVEWPQQQRNLGHVFYCVGMTADYFVRPVDTVEAHVGLLSRVLLSPNYQSLVYLSSTRLYDGLTNRTLAVEDTDFLIKPDYHRHLYDLTKLSGESLCQVMGQGRARIARLSCVYGNTPDAKGFLPELLRKLAQTPVGATLSLASSPHFARDYIHVSDVIQALLGIATNGTQRVYNVASGQTIYNFELANEIARICDRHIVFESDQKQAKTPEIDIRRMQSLLDWRAESVFKTIGPWLLALK